MHLASLVLYPSSHRPLALIPLPMSQWLPSVDLSLPPSLLGICVLYYMRTYPPTRCPLTPLDLGYSVALEQ